MTGRRRPVREALHSRSAHLGVKNPPGKPQLLGGKGAGYAPQTFAASNSLVAPLYSYYHSRDGR